MSNTPSEASITQHPGHRTKGEKWITDKAWISGLAGALSVILCGYFYSAYKVFDHGLHIFGWQITSSKNDSVVAAIIIIAGAMVLTELGRLLLWDVSMFKQRDPLITQKRYKEFFKQCLSVFLLNGLLVAVVSAIYLNTPQHQAWHNIIDFFWKAYLILGFPYIALTRAYKYNPEADKKDYANLVKKCLLFVLSSFPGQENNKPEFGLNEHKATMGLAVKLFFAPLMTSFCFNQFPFLVSNIGYIMDGLINHIANGTYTHKLFNKDLLNVSKSFIFSIDVALAWCGYIVSSRWLDNQTQSAEQTLLGWLVCLLSYPPFQLLGLYFMWPSESAILRFENLWLISFFSLLSILSFFIYTAATIFFGVRFSNLTNRGIIRTGPYALIRHPAYASKNFSWWCVMFPAILLNLETTGIPMVLTMTVGLSVQTWIYYLRAITEERHLSADPQYLEYCKQVKYRFIPGVI